MMRLLNAPVRLTMQLFQEAMLSIFLFCRDSSKKNFVVRKLKNISVCAYDDR